MKKIVFIFIIIPIVAFISGFVTFAYNINHYTVEEGQKADAIIVFTGGKNRIKDAFALFNKGIADKMFISGVQKNVSIETILEHNKLELSKNQTIELGKEARNTVENAIETRNWIQANDIKSIYLVTSNYHMLRSLEEFKYLNPDITIYPVPTYSENVAKRWWTSFGTIRLLASEYVKYLFVCVNHYIYNHFGD